MFKLSHFVLLFSLLILVFTKIIFYSSDEIAGISLDLFQANFGKPALAPVYGRAEILEIPQCSSDLPSVQTERVIVSVFDDCYYSDLAQKLSLNGVNLLYSEVCIQSSQVIYRKKP